MVDDPVLIAEGEGPPAPRVDVDRSERNNRFPANDSVVVAERELSLGKLGVPLDAMEQNVEGLHLTASMMRSVTARDQKLGEVTSQRRLPSREHLIAEIRLLRVKSCAQRHLQRRISCGDFAPERPARWHCLHRGLSDSFLLSGSPQLSATAARDFRRLDESFASSASRRPAFATISPTLFLQEDVCPDRPGV